MCITSFDISALAKEDEYIEVTEDNIEEIVSSTALEWTKLMEPKKELSIGDVKEVYNVANNKMEYIASLFDNVTPYGYVVVGVYDNEMVVLEGNVNKGQEGIYTDIVEQIVESEGRPRRKIEIEETLTKLGPMSYGLGYKDSKGKKAFKDRNGESIEKENLPEIMSYEEYAKEQSIFIDSSSWKTKYELDTDSELKLEKYESRSKLISSGASEDMTKLYACGIQGLMQIAYMERLISTYDKNEYKPAYHKLWYYCNTKKTGEGANGVISGKNNIDDLSKGFIRYTREKNEFYVCGKKKIHL